ncbi:MAG: glycosyltransferase family 4 protein [Desulfarculales bacterium]|jgi:glycosyltransferase involved in cell wall biosynthesis|nr:glycosyltransferase family 4 protein [Desulfarculales bacterium]
MKPLTILFNTYPVAFDCPGGGEVQLLQYEKHLREAGVRVLRYDPWNPKPQLDAADIVHFFSVQGGCWRFPIHVKEVRRLPLVISPIIWIDDPHKYGMREIGFLLRMATHILPNSQAECDQLATLFDLEPSLFTPIVNGVDDIFFTPEPPELFQERFDIHEPFVLCMGNIEERKNQLKLIGALKGTSLHLVLAGQEREAGYAARCRSLADKTVHFVGTLEHGSQLQRSAYAAAEVFALPSTLETPGLAALEAAASGCRLAVTREGCTREYFEDFSVYLDPHDTADIQDAVRTALAAPPPAGLSAFIRKRYTWKHAAEQLINVYRAVLAARAS